MNNKLILIFFISIPPLINPPEIKEEHKLAFKCIRFSLKHKHKNNANYEKSIFIRKFLQKSSKVTKKTSILIYI